MTETVFTYGAPDLKFGVGAADEVGHDLARLGASRVLLVTDPGVAATGWPLRLAESVRAAGVAVEVYDEVHVEPTDVSIRLAVAAARQGPYDAFLAVGGGSALDTAKAVNLLTTNPGDVMDYVNPPIGGGQAPRVPLRPLVAVPTTTGTGSEATTICVLDVLALRVKTGISHPALRPSLAVVDPRLTITQPAMVTAASGLDVVCHALESWTAKPYTQFEAREAYERVPYCGANPVADLWAREALRLLGPSLRRALADGADLSVRTDMAMAATFAGLGFGNAGVHLPHACAYPIAGRVRDFRPAGYPQEEALVPHGMAVAMTAPAAFAFTFDACPDRHLWAAEVLAGDTDLPDEPARRLPAALLRVMRDVGMPDGLAALGYDEGDIDDLVEGTMSQHRLLATAPRPVTRQDVAGVLRASMRLW
jgi:hydroxyacid-oxoacid transhydrogenase